MPSGYHSFLTFIRFHIHQPEAPPLFAAADDTDIKLGINHRQISVLIQFQQSEYACGIYRPSNDPAQRYVAMNGGESRDLRNVMSYPPAVRTCSHYKYSKASSKPPFQTCNKATFSRPKKVSYIGIVFGSGTMFSASFCYQCFWWVFSNKIQVIGYS